LQLSRDQIEIVIIGALILVFLVYNFGGFNGVPTNNNSTVHVADISANALNESENGNTNHISTTAYSNYGVSFNYPSTWSVYADSSGDNVIFASKDDSTNFQVQIMPSNGISEQEAISQINNTINLFGWWNKISSTTLTVNNKTAYMDTFIVYSLIPPIIDGKFEQIYFVKNNKTYLILLQAQEGDFDKEKPNFDIILNSFKVQ
jgi:hypothetical protein